MINPLLPLSAVAVFPIVISPTTSSQIPVHLLHTSLLAHIEPTHRFFKIIVTVAVCEYCPQETPYSIMPTGSFDLDIVVVNFIPVASIVTSLKISE